MRVASLLCALAALASFPAALVAPVPRAQDEYFHLDNVEGTWIDLGLPPVRPMAYDQSTLELFALNAHDSTLQVFGTFGPPTHTWRLPWGPRSLALYDAGPDATPRQRVLVVCAGDQVLAAIDRASGDVIGLLQLPAEPGDLLVAADEGRAFVSCGATDQVVEVDLSGPMSIVRSFAIPSKHPLFLSFDAGGDVLVAPLVSGNNSVVDKPVGGGTNEAGPRGILDLELPSVALSGLPDEDLFRLDRASGAVTPVATDVGTILFAHGRNPYDEDGRVWVLNTEANNKDPNRQSEAGVRGEVVVNRISILSALAPGTKPSKVIDLDDSDPTTAGRQVDTTRTVGQPYALEFLPGGFALVAGLLTDNVTALDAAGDWLFEWDLDPGAIPRALVYSAPSAALFVYQWGTNDVVAYDMTVYPPGRIWTFDLGHDPAPPLVREGRELFYDGSFSAHENASCASCHVDGRSDGLAWNLGKPQDDKGPMVTQLLTGLDVRQRFHWRAEQLDLEAFNDAFLSLLGASRKMTTGSGGTPGEFDRLAAFVLSLQSPANPYQHRERLLDPALQPPLRQGAVQVADAVLGRDLFGVGAESCAACHQLPLATSNTTTPDNGSPVLKRVRMKVAPFHELYRKEQDRDPATPGIQEVSVVLLDAQGMPEPPRLYPVLGHGLAHSGLQANLHEFVQLFSLPAKDIADITAFVFQFDQGLAPAVHRAFLLTQDNLATQLTEVRDYLVPQADLRNCDVVVIGRVDVGRGVEPMAWTYDRVAQLFVPEDLQVTPRTLEFLLSEVELGRSNLFLGLPVGMGERFGIDFDQDDLPNRSELALQTGVYVPDTDGDTFPDGHEVRNPLGNPKDPTVVPNDGDPPGVRHVEGRFVTGRVARLLLETDEPTKARVDYTVVGPPGTSSFVESPGFSKHHDLILGDLLPSTFGNLLVSYQGDVTVTDHGGNPLSTGSLPPFRLNGTQLGGPLPSLLTWFFSSLDAEEVLLGDLVATPARNGSSLTLTVTARADLLLGGPPHPVAPGYRIIGRVFVDGVLDPTFTSPGRVAALTEQGQPWTGLAGPFVVSPITDSAGATTFQVTVPNLSANQVVELIVEAVAKPVGTSTTDFQAIGKWNLAETPKAFRAASETF